eukprot:9526990-Ditylum_brightwellii.AAC.1
MGKEFISAKTPGFNGKSKSFQGWWIHFQAYTKVKNVSTALKTCREMPANEEEITTLAASSDEDGKKKIAADKRNDLAMAHLTVVLGTEALLEKINILCSDNWPGGLAYNLIELLKEEYQPKD